MLGAGGACAPTLDLNKKLLKPQMYPNQLYGGLCPDLAIRAYSTLPSSQASAGSSNCPLPKNPGTFCTQPLGPQVLVCFIQPPLMHTTLITALSNTRFLRPTWVQHFYRDHWYDNVIRELIILKLQLHKTLYFYSSFVIFLHSHNTKIQQKYC